MKKVYLIHGWGGRSEGGWFDWLKDELTKKGDKVVALNMPNTDAPKIEEWVGYLETAIDAENLNEKTFFVGHSIGCQTIMRFLEKIHKHKKIGGCVFVAPWLDLTGLQNEELQIAHPWTEGKIEFERVLDHTGNITCIFSTNDPYVSEKEWTKFEKNLGAKIIVKKDFGHFDDTDEIPEILEHLH